MAPKATTPKKTTWKKSKAEMDREKDYMTRLKQLKTVDPHAWLRAQAYCTKHNMSYGDTWRQIELEKHNEIVAKRGPNEQGDCAGCQEPFSKALGRPKMKSKRCGHLLCGSCVENLYMLNSNKCTHLNCGQMLKSSDWEDWQPTPKPSGYAFGELLPFDPTLSLIPRPPQIAPPPQLPTSQINSGSADDEGLFVPEEEGSGLSGEDGGDDDLEIKS
jgi:hypothetical protein